MLTKENQDLIVDSHDELRLVCQSLFAIILKHELLEEVDGPLFAQGVKPGFVERAEAAREAVAKERLREVRNSVIN